MSLGENALRILTTTVLEIRNNPSLTHLGENSIRWNGCNNTIVIRDNPLLSICEDSGLCERVLTSGCSEGVFSILDNAPGCNSFLELQSACLFGCPPEDTVLSSQAEVLAFLAEYPDCENLRYALTIEGDDISDLSPLSNITSVGEKLFINDNPSLATLAGLESVTSIGGMLQIRNNPLLTSLEPLSNVTRAARGLQVVNNDALVSLDGLELVSTVFLPDDSLEILRIKNNNLLNDIEALELFNYTELDELDISNNPMLSNCSIGSICNYFALSGVSIVSNNAEGCDNEAQIITECSENFGRIYGQLSLDLEGAGCEEVSYPLESVSIAVEGSLTYTVITNPEGEYSIFVNQEDSYVVTPNAIAGFEFSPESVPVVFPFGVDEQEVNFCLEGIEEINDVSVAIVPIFEARPGFEPTYQLVLQNNGTTSFNGQLTLSFDDSRVALILQPHRQT